MSYEDIVTFAQDWCARLITVCKDEAINIVRISESPMSSTAAINEQDIVNTISKLKENGNNFVKVTINSHTEVDIKHIILVLLE
jgi:aspartokinase